MIPPGSTTPVHDHLTWGLIGLYKGRQQEIVYRRVDQGETEGHAKLEVLEVRELKPGDIYYLLPPEGDIHAVKTITRFAPSVSIHVLGNGTGCVWRNQYNLKKVYALFALDTPTHPVKRRKIMPKFDIPQPPVFDRVEDERLYRKQRLAAALRIFARLGFSEGIAGHITARDPEFPDHFWVNPFGVYFGHICVSNLILVDTEGEVVKGNYPVNRAAFAIHSQVHEARLDIIAAAHAHSLYGKTWSTLHRLLDPLTQDACAFYEDHELFDEYKGVVLDPSEGKRIAEALGNKKAIILPNHGHLTVGHTVDEAAWWYITFERSAQAQLLAEAAGKPIPIDPDTARLAQSQVGKHKHGWFSFQPLYDKIVREEPDLLD